MEQYDQAISSTNAALNSAGSGYRENEEYMKSFEARINKVKNAWTEAIIAMQDSGLGDAMILGLQAGLDFLQFFTKIIDTIGIFPTVVGGASIALALLNSSFRTLATTTGVSVLNFLKNLPSYFKNIETSSKSASAGIDTMSRTAKNSTANVNALGKAMNGIKGFAAGALPVAGIMAVTSAITYFIDKAQEAKRAQEDFQNQLREMSNQFDMNRQDINTLATEYTELEKVISSGIYNTEEAERYKEIQNELAQLMPSLVKGEDEYGNKILITSKEVENRIALSEKQLEVQQKLNEAKASEEAQESYDSVIGEFEKYEKAIDDVLLKYQLLANQQNDAISPFSSEDKFMPVVYSVEELNNQITLLQQKMAETPDLFSVGDEHSLEFLMGMRNEIEALSMAHQQNAMILVDANMTLISSNQQLKDVYSDSTYSMIQGFSSFTASAVSDFATIQSVLDRFRHDIENNANTRHIFKENELAVQEYAEALARGLTGDELTQHRAKADETLGAVKNMLLETAREAGVSGEEFNRLSADIQNMLDSVIGSAVDWETAAKNNGTTVEELARQHDIYIDALDGATDANNNLTETIWADTEAKFENANAAQILFGWTKEQIAMTEQAIGIVSMLSDVENLSEDQKLLLADATEYLAGQFPHMSDNIYANIDAIIAEISKLSDLSNVSGSAARDMMRNQDSTTKSTVGAVNQRITAYSKENKALSGLQSNLKAAGMAATTLSAIPGMGAVGKALRAASVVVGGVQQYNYERAVYQSTMLDTYHSAGVSSGAISSPKKSSSGSSKKPKSSSSKKPKSSSSKKPKSSSSSSKKKTDAEKAREKALKDAAKAEQDAARAAEEAQRRVLEIVNKQIDAYRHKADMLNDEIALEEFYLAKYEKTSQAYRQRQSNIAQLKAQQANYYLDNIRYMENQLKTNKKLNSEQRKEVEKTLTSTKSSYYGMLKDIESINKDIKASYEQVADEVIAVYKEAYQKMKEIAIKANEKELESARKTHNEKIKLLDEELSKYEKIIQKKLETIDKEKNDEDFQKELTKKQKERIELIQRIEKLSMDDSVQGRAKVAELKNELSEKEAEIQEFLADREREKRKEALNQQLEDKREQIEEEREIENEKFNEFEANLNKEKEKIEQHYENLLNDERAWAKMRQDILNGNVKNMTNTLAGFSKTIGANMSTIGKSITQNLLDKISDAQKKLKDVTKTYNNMQVKVEANKKTPAKSTTTTKKPTTTTKKPTSTPKKATVGGKVKVNKANASAYMDAYGKQVRPWTNQAKAAGVGYYDPLYLVNQKNGYGAVAKKKGVANAIAWIKMNDLVGFDTGGYTGDFNGGKLAMLHKKELVLNAHDTDNMFQILDAVRSIVSDVPRFEIPSDFGGSSENVEFNFYIDNLGTTQEDANNFLDSVKSNLRGKGYRFR